MYEYKFGTGKESDMFNIISDYWSLINRHSIVSNTDEFAENLLNDLQKFHHKYENSKEASFALSLSTAFISLCEKKMKILEACE